MNTVGDIVAYGVLTILFLIFLGVLWLPLSSVFSALRDSLDETKQKERKMAKLKSLAQKKELSDKVSLISTYLGKMEGDYNQAYSYSFEDDILRIKRSSSRRGIKESDSYAIFLKSCAKQVFSGYRDCKYSTEDVEYWGFSSGITVYIPGAWEAHFECLALKAKKVSKEHEENRKKEEWKSFGIE